MDDREDFQSLALQLSDLEVALLLSLAANEHCLIETTEDCIHDVAKELTLICSNTFGRSCRVLECSYDTSFEDFYYGIFATDWSKSVAHSRTRKGVESIKTESMDRAKSPISWKTSFDRTIVDVVVASNFNLVDDDIQLQALELMLSKKLNTQHGTIEAPSDFLFVPLVVRVSEWLKPRLNYHLNDHLILSHMHEASDGYVYLEHNSDWLSDGQTSVSSVVRKSETVLSKQEITVDQEMLDRIQQASNSVSVGADIVRYQQDLVAFLRLNRAVSGGITARSNMQFSKLAKLLATLHGIDYLTPSIVAVAARKAFRHRIILAQPEDDRSLQYGSDKQVVAEALAHISPDTILDDVLTVEAPL